MILKNKYYFRFEKKNIASIEEKKLFKNIATKTINNVVKSEAVENIFIAIKDSDIDGFTVNVIFTDDEDIHKINKEYRNVDRPTDVLSFPINDFEYGDGEIILQNVDEDLNLLMLGDIIISVPTMKKQGEEYGHGIERECSFLVCHSMLHLFGYDHMNEQDEKCMTEHAEAILNEIGYKR